MPLSSARVAAIPRRATDFEHHLGVGRAAEADAGQVRAASDVRRIVDLAVVGDDPAAVMRDHRLRAGRRQIDDGEAAMCEGRADVRFAPHARTVRTAMGDGIGHRAGAALERSAVSGRRRINQAGNAAHPRAISPA